MITTLVVLACLFGYLAPSVYAIRKSRDLMYLDYFNKQLAMNEGRLKTDPSHSDFMTAHRNYSALYPNRREWCRDMGYKMPGEWILADYSWSDSYARDSRKKKDSYKSLVLGLAWPFAFAFCLGRWVYRATLGEFLEPPSMKKQQSIHIHIIARYSSNDGEAG